MSGTASTCRDGSVLPCSNIFLKRLSTSTHEQNRCDKRRAGPGAKGPQNNVVTG
jgi:hypothetical protein